MQNILFFAALLRFARARARRVWFYLDIVSIMRRSATSPLISGLLTDTGLQRSINQDAALALELPQGGLYAVADGMGGHVAGELAANLALDHLSTVYLDGRGQPPERLAEAVQAANLAVVRHAVGEYVGMGTTLIVLVVDRGLALIAHVGDSRAYLLRAQQLHRLTEDHSWVAEQVRLGHLSEDEARSHQWRSVVSNALGGEERVRLELYGFRLRQGDRLLLCSDGLSGVVSEARISELLQNGDSPEQTARRLVAAANDEGSPDNVTAVVADVLSGAALPRYAVPTRREEGPQYVDLLMGTGRGTSPTTYLLLVLCYFLLMALVLYPQYRSAITVLGLGLLSGLILSIQWRRFQTRSRLPELPTLPKVLVKSEAVL